MVAAGQSSTAQPVTVTNSSSYAIGSVVTCRPARHSASRKIRAAASLAAGANCTASVVFQPSAGGSASGSLTVTSSAVATPATVALSGTGFDFAVDITGSASQTVASGQQGNYTLVISPTGSGGYLCFFLRHAALECALPLQSRQRDRSARAYRAMLRSKSPPATGLRLASRNPGTRPCVVGRSRRPHRLVRALPLTCALVLLPVAVSSAARSFLLLVLAVILVGGVSSCTSSGGGTGRHRRQGWRLQHAAGHVHRSRQRDVDGRHAVSESDADRRLSGRLQRTCGRLSRSPICDYTWSRIRESRTAYTELSRKGRICLKK